MSEIDCVRGFVPKLHATKIWAHVGHFCQNLPQQSCNLAVKNQNFLHVFKILSVMKRNQLIFDFKKIRVFGKLSSKRWATPVSFGNGILLNSHISKIPFANGEIVALWKRALANTDSQLWPKFHGIKFERKKTYTII